MAHRTTIRFGTTQALPSLPVRHLRPGSSRLNAGERNGRPFLHVSPRDRRARRSPPIAKPIFDLHHQAIEWLEDYTKRKYPFEKFDFVLLPAFQFSGMEHAGAIYYNAPALLSGQDGHPAPASGPRQPDCARDGAHVVRRPRHHEVVRRRVAEGSVRELHGRQDRESHVSRNRSRAALSCCSTIRLPTTSTAPPAQTRFVRSSTT